MVMLFENEKSRQQLLTKGEVFTFRVKQHKEGKDWATDKRLGKKIADINVVSYGKVKLEDLDTPSILELSGFANMIGWTTAIIMFNKGIAPESGYLYYVRDLGMVNY